MEKSDKTKMRVVPYAHWIDKGLYTVCSHCGWTINDEYYLGDGVACPNCGAYMEQSYKQMCEKQS